MLFLGFLFLVRQQILFVKTFDSFDTNDRIMSDSDLLAFLLNGKRGHLKQTIHTFRQTFLILQFFLPLHFYTWSILKDVLSQLHHFSYLLLYSIDHYPPFQLGKPRIKEKRVKIELVQD